MALFLTVHTRYHDIELGLFKNSSCIGYSQIGTKKASACLLYLLQALLSDQKYIMEDLDFIAVNQGPAPFTALRVALASINGIAYATQLPLVGVNGLEMFSQEYPAPENYIGIALLNAFCQDVYYAIAKNNSLETGYSNITLFLDTLKNLPDNFYFIGNGVELYRLLIQEKLKNRASIPEPLPQIASLQMIANQALIFWQTQENIYNQVMPLYIKGYSAQIACKQ